MPRRLIILHLGILRAEREGFEPPDLLQSTVFKTAAIDRSAISPGSKLGYQKHFQKFFSKNTTYFMIPCYSGLKQ